MGRPVARAEEEGGALQVLVAYNHALVPNARTTSKGTQAEMGTLTMQRNTLWLYCLVLIGITDVSGKSIHAFLRLSSIYLIRLLSSDFKSSLRLSNIYFQRFKSKSTWITRQVFMFM